MAMRSQLTRILLCSYLLLVQCSSSSLHRAASAVESPIRWHGVDPAFLAGANLLDGFDQPSLNPAWEADASVLLGVKVTGEEGDDVWFVRLTAMSNEFEPNAAPESRDFPLPVGVGKRKAGTAFNVPAGWLRIEIFDQKARRLRSSVRVAPQVCPTITLVELCQMLSDTPGTAVLNADALPPKWTNDGEGLVTLITMLQPVGRARALRPIREAIRESVIKRPTVLGILLGGLKIHLETEFAACRRPAPLNPAAADLGPLFDVTMPVAMSGQRLFDCRMVVGPSASPYNLTAGVLQLEAVHPDKPSNRLMVQMLAAKRGGQNAFASAAE